jgi:hypothetical protein
MEALKEMKKTPRVADESMCQNEHILDIQRRRNHHHHHRSWNGISFICSIVRAPLTLLSCFYSTHSTHTTDTLWVTNNPTRRAEFNELVVNDSMRYAILM